MSDGINLVEKAALSLAEGSRALLASLAPRDPDEIDRAWMDEAQRRYEAIRSGAARTLPHDQVVVRLEARAG